MTSSRFAIHHRTTDKGVLLQDIQGGNDFADALTGIFDLIDCQMVKDAIEVLGDFRGQFDSGHVSRPVFGPGDRFAGGHNLGVTLFGHIGLWSRRGPSDYPLDFSALRLPGG